MIKLTIYTTLFCLSALCYSQTAFDEGYFVTEDDARVECFIKNMDWKNNPTDFVYRLKVSSDQQTGSIESVKEFGIYNKSKYIRRTVKMDRSSKQTDELTTNRNPVFKEERLFLKVLVDGGVSLLQFEDRNLMRFFISDANYSDIRQLIFKEFIKLSKDTEQMHVVRNELYKQQLISALDCESISFDDILKTNYSNKHLLNLFVKYRKCDSSLVFIFTDKQSRDHFNLNIRPGINHSSLLIKDNRNIGGVIDFGAKTGIRFGAEVEFIFPFNNNKTSLVIEPTYQHYKAKGILASDNALPDQEVVVDYKSIDLTVGLRQYFFLNDHSRIFINGLVVYDFSLNSNVKYEGGDMFDVNSKYSMAVGLGYKFKERCSFEIRYFTKRDILITYIPLSANYQMASVIFGYTLFKR